MSNTAERKYDAIVCGGGPAGIGAGLAAAREGAKTLVVEQLGHLGGMAAGAGLIKFCDTPGGPIYDEFIRRLMDCGAARFDFNPEAERAPGRIRFQPEPLKALAAKMLREAGADILLQTVISDVWVEDGRVRGVFVANKSGRHLVEAETVIDCAGDADVAALAGCEFRQGDPDDKRIQHVNFRFGIGPLDAERFRKDNPSDAAITGAFQAAIRAGELSLPGGLFDPAPDSFPFSRVHGRVILNCWEIERVDPADPWQVSRALSQCQQAALEFVQICRRILPGYEKAELSRLPACLGTRESRRIVGRHTLTKEDVLRGVKYDDGIARCWFWIDLHDSPPGASIPYPVEHVWQNQPAKGDWYEIPFRCLQPLGLEGLLVAGRSISLDREAHGSARTMPTCFFLGTAAGTAAAMAAQRGIGVEELDIRLVRERVMSSDWILDLSRKHDAPA